MPTAVRTRVAALSVPASQVALAASGYLVLVAVGRGLPAAAFTAVSAFYLLLNTVGRGVFAAVELELTRAVAAARATGDPGRRTVAALLPRALGLLVAALVLLGAAVPLLAAVVGDDPVTVALLFAGAVSVAASYFLRGPLAALGRYRAYAATFAVEAVCCLAGAAALAVAGEDRPGPWCAVFALAPLAAALVVGLAVGRAPLRRRMASELRGPGAAAGEVSTAGLLWSALLFLASQGVWNLAVVVVAARAERPETAAGFAAVAVLLRAPVLVFPAVQALLLPRVSAEAARGGRGLLAATLRRWATPLALAAVAWMAAAVLVVPPVTRLVFGLDVLPGAGVLAALAAAALLGAAAQVAQTQLVARGRARAVALAWLAGLVVLLAVAAAPIPGADVAGGAAQVLGAAVVIAALAGVLRR